MVQDGILEYLLDLNGQQIEMNDGYWVKFKVRQVEPTDFIPHGISYSFTLHDRHNNRILGYDNAHQVKPSGNPFKFAGQVIAYDHKHPHGSKTPVPYHFQSGEQLMTDFWSDVNSALKQENGDE